MTTREELLAGLLRENPFQPATSWWRAVELEAVIKHGLPSGKGLDLGCGDGKLMRLLLDGLATSPPALVGADIDPLETRDAAASGVYQRVHTTPGSRIPEPDASFDFVYSNSVLEHIDDLEPVIAEVSRLLKPGGRFVFTVPAERFHECLAGPLLPWREREQYLRRLDRRCAHRRYWSEEQWAACLQRHAMEIVTALRYLTRREVQRWETLSRFTAGILYTLVGERLQPIEIQRRLGVRRRRLRLPQRAARLAGRVISVGVRPDAAGVFGCLLVDGRKRT
ncbi:MAG TPA: class I SAM-dependent methyltransferase [Burkholderiales bacterium]|nr:class I SAM-dependent methyltransferase [Burkholderiales bacterium]